MLKIKKTTILISCIFSITTYTQAANKTHIPKNAHMLFVQLGETAIITKQKNHNVLHMQGIHQNTLWFTDRPYHMAGTIKTQKFVKSWSKRKKFDFNRMNPNAEFVAYVMPNKQQQKTQLKSKSITLELSHPKYSAKNKELTYNVKILYPAKYKNSTPRTLYNYSLFIDSSCSVWNFWDC